jgi:hypothetical protein
MVSTLIPQDRVRAHFRPIVRGELTRSLSVDAHGKRLASVLMEMEIPDWESRSRVVS